MSCRLEGSLRSSIDRSFDVDLFPAAAGKDCYVVIKIDYTNN